MELAALLLVLGAQPSTDLDPLFVQASSACQPTWLPTFGAEPGVDDAVKAMAVFDDGSGPVLYAGGFFSSAGGVPAKFIARWDGSSWSALGGGGSGLNNIVCALAVYDDGSGPALYVGGGFSSAGGVPANRIAKWNGSSWSALGTGMSGGLGSTLVTSLAVFDEGGGAALYAGGTFTTAGGVAANDVAKWDGSSWSALGSGVSGGLGSSFVDALTVFDDGGGPALYAGGDFTIAGGVTVNRVAKWDGTGWSALGTGIGGPFTSVLDLAVFDDGSGGGPALVAGGEFTSAGGSPANRAAKWDGASWSALGTGLDSDVFALAVFDDGGGPDLYAGGVFSSAGGVTANRVAKWDGSSWSPLGSGTGGTSPFDIVYAFGAFDDGGGALPALLAGGSFTSAGGVPANNVAKWNGSGWSSLGGNGLGDTVAALALFDDGTGPALYAGGSFTFAGGVPANRIAKWDGTSWSALGSGLNDPVLALTVFDDGAGSALYAGGFFTSAGGVAATSIARWDGASWSALGSGMDGDSRPDVLALAVFDDVSGGGPALFAAGTFTFAGGVVAKRIAKWDGTSWFPLGSGLNNVANAFAVFDDGSGGGPALYTGGSFGTAGGLLVSGIAKWDGSIWSALAGGMNGGISALAVFDDGGGPDLYAGGFFTLAGGVAANSIARWNGSSWSALANNTSSTIKSLRVFDDGRGGGPDLYAGGTFTVQAGIAANRIAKWNGTTWSALESGVSGGFAPSVDALAVFDDGSGPALFAGGSFTVSPGGDAYLAKWGCPTPPPTVYCTAKPSSCGTLPSMGSTGRPSATAGHGFMVSIVNAKAQKSGLLLYTDAGRGNTPFGGGTLCLNLPLRRSVAVSDSSGTPPMCNGVLSIDMNAFAVGLLGGNPLPSLTLPGTRIDCQFWGRDTVANGALLSDGLEYFVGS